jgi:hypothetical protein
VEKMKLPSNIHLRRSATVLLVWMLLLACSLFPFGVRSSETATNQPAGAGTLASGQVLETTAPTGVPAGQTAATATPTSEATATTGPYTLEISDSYPLFKTKAVYGYRLTASPGKVWIGNPSGGIIEVDSQSGAFGQSIVLQGGESGTAILTVEKLAFEGKYLWALAATVFEADENGNRHSYLFAIDSGSLTVAHQWDMNTPEWTRTRSECYSAIEDFGVSPGKIWIDGHIIDTQTFEVTPNIYMICILPSFAYNGIDWMWLTGDNGGDCQDLALVNTGDPSTVWCPSNWPFLVGHQEAGGTFPTGPGSSMVLAGDRMWIAGNLLNAPTGILEAYWADMDKAMQETGPLASAHLIDSASVIRMLYAGNTLWVVYTNWDKAGFLYQLDPQTGATINSLDLVGDQGRSISDYPMDIASEGDNLWVVTARQLLRIKLP